MDYVWQTSWGLSTRSLGGLFLTHGDDNGLILPPRIAPTHVVIVPIFKTGNDAEKLTGYCRQLWRTLEEGDVRVKLDDRQEPSVGRKFHEWELRGVPVRFEIGEKELREKTVTVVRRDTGEKISMDTTHIFEKTKKLLETIQKDLFDRAKRFLNDHTHEVSSYEEFKKVMATTRGFLRAFWCEDASCEAKIKEETKASTRCLPMEENDLSSEALAKEGSCIYCGKPATHRWLFAQAY